jgi:hypothetical protein
MLNLKNITLAAMSSIDIDKTIKALEYSSKDINFYEVKLISDIAIKHEYIKHEHIDKITNIEQWNQNIFFNLTNYINSDYVILIHDDGFIVNADSWRSEFFDYDYIGAPWAYCDNCFITKYGEHIRVGNSVSLRSKKLIDIPKKLKIPWQKFENNYNEDTQICVHNRQYFLDNGIKFAPLEVAKYFSHETYLPELLNIKPFAFHNYGYPGHINNNYVKF